jgi:uncharacterized protein YdeI (YjbR/CyaY-like superfamily)
MNADTHGSIPADLLTALKAAGAAEAFVAMSPSCQREHLNAIDEAKKPETRARRIEGCIKMVKAMSKANSNRARKEADRTPRARKAAPK